MYTMLRTIFGLKSNRYFRNFLSSEETLSDISLSFILNGKYKIIFIFDGSIKIHKIIQFKYTIEIAERRRQLHFLHIFSYTSAWYKKKLTSKNKYYLFIDLLKLFKNGTACLLHYSF